MNKIHSSKKTSCERTVIENTERKNIILGRFGKAYGVRGWLRIYSYTHPEKNIFNYSHWKIKIRKKWEEITVEKKQMY
jgi:16S rRNA processing protein RimM